MVWTSSSWAASLIAKSLVMSSSSNSSLSCPGRLNSQHFHCVFPAALPCCQQNILYVAILQQPSLVIKLERQSSYEEDDSICSLVCIFCHLCSTQIYLGSFEPHTDHVASTTLHIVAALDDVMDLFHDHGFHHHVLALPPNNITLAHIFHPIYQTMTTLEWEAYEESDLRTTLPHVVGHFHIDCPEYECPNCHQRAPNHLQYHCNRNYCSFCCCFSHTPHYCPDCLCALCNNPGHVITDCPFSEDPSSGVIFNDGDPEGLWSCPSGASLWRGQCYGTRVWPPFFLLFICHCCCLILLSCSPFWLGSFQTLTITSYGKPFPF